MRLPAPSIVRRAVAFSAVAALLIGAAPVGSAPRSPEPALKSDMEKAAEAASKLPPAKLGRTRTEIPADRYAMAGGCYAIQSATGKYITRAEAAPAVTANGLGGAEPFHFQATRLGEYLLYGTAKDFLAASEGEAEKTTEPVTESSVGAAVGGLTMENSDKAAREVTHGPVGTASGRGASILLADKPSELADWRARRVAGTRTFRFVLPSLDQVLINDAGTLKLVPHADADGRDLFRLQLVDGCAPWPEISTNVRGPVDTGETRYSEVSGYFDAHLHAMAFEFLGGRARCGRVWHPYGVEYALRGCREHEIAGGRAAVLENFLSGRDPVAGHDTNAGWPTFADWPRPESLTYEQVYYKWLERSWRGGLRMFTNLLVDNNQLCKLYPYKRNSCNEMEGVRLQWRRIHELQNYVDAQYGGPGRGWLRIVTDPFEARRVMNDGKLAVVLGIEVSVLFDCGVTAGVAKCTTDDIDQRLAEVYDMGVRQMELVNKFDNALSGVTGDGGVIGPIVNGANFMETGKFWPMKTCADDAGHAHDKEQPNVSQAGAPKELVGRDALVGILLQEAGGSGAAPVYGPGPHCSQLGLSPLGEHLVRGMLSRGMLFDPDHMSAKARTAAMQLVESEGYSGVISSHGWADDTIYPWIFRLGGVVTPHGGTSASFVEKWKRHRPWADERFFFGLGFGSDMNGFSTQGAAPGADTEHPVTYPFTGLGGVTVGKQVSGQKSFDYNVEGVAHYGMYLDFVEHVRRIAGDAPVRDMARGAEAMLQTWERAIGVPPASCRTDVRDLRQRDLDRVRDGMSPERVLLLLGQPWRRRGDTYTYCTSGGAQARVIFGANGRVAEIRQTEPARSTAPRPEPVQTHDPTPIAATGTSSHATDGSHDHGARLAASRGGPVAGPLALIAILGMWLLVALRRRRPDDGATARDR